MNETLSATRLNALANEIGNWARQFKASAPGLGFLEELGEMSHCILKRLQGIRGFDDELHYTTELADAIGDAAIYLLHFCHQHEIRLATGTMAHESAHIFHNQNGALHVLTQCAGDFISPEPDRSMQITAVGDALECLATIATHNHLDFDQIVIKTWVKVSKRDWASNPADAHVDSQK